MSNIFSKISEQLASVQEQVAPLQEDFPQLVDEFNAECKNFAIAAEKKNADGRVLSISMVGRVKSGKSSLLNALLFDGANVLPQAATPMTAALTYIRYAPDCRAEIDFFSADEWNGFIEQDRKYRQIVTESRQNLQEREREEEDRCKRLRKPYRQRTITPEIVANEAEKNLNENFTAAHELVTMAQKSGLEVEQFLGRTETVTASSPEELAGKLENYVGAAGRFTPLVCSSTIYINDERLNGYEIIDTPGTNDPIISRGKKTNRSLAQTDVVFALSPSGTFFDNGDWQLLSQNLPRNGVKHFEIIASQYDLSVGQIADKEIPQNLPPEKRVAYGMKFVQNELSGTFRSRVEKLIEQAIKTDATDCKKWERIANTVPICVSAKAYSLAKNWNNLTQQEKDELKIFNNLIPGYTFDRESLEGFSRLQKVHQKIDAVRTEKASIIAESLQNLVTSNKDKFIALARGMLTAVANSINTLESKDVQQLQKEIKFQTQKLDKGRITLEGAFDEAISMADNKFAGILNEVRTSKSQFAKLDVQTESHTESEDYTVDKGCGFLGWRSLTGNRYETRTRSYTVTTRYADAYQAADLVEDFAEKARVGLEKAIRESVDVKALQNAIADGVLALFDGDTGDTDLDLLKEQVKSAARRITVPDADFGDMDYAALITTKFSGRVEGRGVDKLRAIQREALTAVIANLEAKAKNKIKKITASLEGSKNTFVPKLISDLRTENEHLLSSLQNKEEALSKLKALLPVTEQIVAHVQQM